MHALVAFSTTRQQTGRAVGKSKWEKSIIVQYKHEQEEGAWK